MKKIVIGILTLVFAISGICFYSADKNEVLAAAGDVTTGNGFIAVEYNDLSTYIKSGTNKNVAPSAPNGYADYIFSGWYQDSKCEKVYSNVKGDTSLAYAKFVPQSILSVKLQLKADTIPGSASTNMRLVSSVDSANYKTIGFDVYYNGATTPVKAESSKVFERIVASVESGVDYNYSAKVVDIESKYFVTATLVNIKSGNFGKSFHIEPYWITMDGTVVYGVGRYVTVNNGLDDNNINIPVKVGSEFNVEGAPTVTVTDGTVTSVTVAHYDGKYAHLNIGLESSKTALKSLSVVTVKEGETELGKAEYRNLKTKYDGTVGTIDTSWYDNSLDKNNTVIATSADLYGFASKVDGGTTFSNQKVYLISDIEVNKGRATTTGWSTTDAAGNAITGATSTPLPWTPIGECGPDGWFGSDDKVFAGTFDGQMHTISGLYLNTDVKGLGLFAIQKGTISNLSLKNSYFNSTLLDSSVKGYNRGSFLGSIVGFNDGTVSKVYSNAILAAKDANVGGIIGRAYYNTCHVLECWFDGEINLTTSTGASAAGIVGYAFTQNTPTYNIKDCLFTGKITTEAGTSDVQWGIGVGGILGNTYGNNSTINMTNCVSAGTIEQSTTGKSKGSNGIALVAGNIAYTVELNLENVYATKDSSTDEATQIVYYDGMNLAKVTGECNIVSQNELAGYTNREVVKDLGIYTNNENNQEKVWVITKDGAPELRAFSEEWFDFGWYDKRKTGEDYKIATAEELYAFSLVSGTDTFSGETVKLVKDIKLNNGTASVWKDNQVVPSRVFTPIGKTTAFTGTFDGQMHTISGLYVNNTASDYAGLFGQVSGKVKNFRLENSYINSTKPKTGSIVGLLTGDVEGVFSDAYVTTTHRETGGIVGKVMPSVADKNISITGCWFDGTVKSNQDSQGGIVGRVSSGMVTMRDCLNTGDIISTVCWNEGVANTYVYAGGLLGIVGIETGVSVQPSLIMQNCLNIGEVQAVGLRCVGSVIGRTFKAKSITIENVYTTDQVVNIAKDQGKSETEQSFIKDYGHFGIGSNSNQTGSKQGRVAIVSDELLEGEQAYFNTDLSFYSNSDSSGVWVVITGKTPELKAFSSETIIGDFGNGLRKSTDWYYNNTKWSNDTTPKNSVAAYTIQNEADFYGLAEIVNQGVETFSGKTVSLAKDMQLNGDVTEKTVETWVAGTTPTNIWTPIGKTTAFAGIFEGQMHTINGLYVNNTESIYAGLFGQVSGKVMNFRLENSYINSTKDMTGSIVGYLSGNMEDVFSDAYVNSTGKQTGGLVGLLKKAQNDTATHVFVSDSWFAGTVKCTNTYTGGIAAHCIVESELKIISNCLNTGTISGAYATGGIIGGTTGSSGSKKGFKTLDCLNTGTVTSNSSNYGAIHGYTTVAAAFENAYTTVNVGGSGGLTGLGTTSLQYEDVVFTGEPILLTAANATGRDAYIYTDLGFYDTNATNNVWAIVDGGTPVIKKLYNGKVETGLSGQKVSTNWYYNAKVRNKDTGLTNVTENYSISDEADFYGFAQVVNSGAETFEGKKVLLTKDLKLNGDVTEKTVETWVAGTEPANLWTPIGTSDHPFKGTFDGASKTISGLYTKREMSDIGNVGLFGVVDNPIIKNVRLVDSYLSFTSTGKDKHAQLGAIVGTINGAGNGTLDNIYTNATLVSNERRVGGFVGYVERTGAADTTSLNITNGWFDGKIIVDSQTLYTGGMYVGGLVGYAYKGTTSLDTCLYSGSMECIYKASSKQGTSIHSIAGLVGSDGTAGIVTIEDSIAAGTIHLEWKKFSDETSVTSHNICDIIGSVNNYSSTRTEGTVLALVDITRTSEASGKTNEITSTYNTYKRAENLNEDNFSCISNALDGSEEQKIYGINAHVNTTLAFEKTADNDTTIWLARSNALPVPSTMADVVDDEMYVDTSWYDDGAVYEISDAADLYGLVKLSNTNNFAGKTIKLTQNITVNEGDASEWSDAAPTIQWYPIAPVDRYRFEGTFDGQGNTISGLYSKLNITDAGLFALTGKQSTIKNLRLVNSYISEANPGTACYVGSIAGKAQGKFDNIYSNAYIVSDNQEAGGLISRITTDKLETEATEGYAHVYINTNGKHFVYDTTPSVTNCWFDGVVDIGVGRYAGGVVGTVFQGGIDMSNCLFTGTIKTDHADHAKNTNVGGIIGSINAQPGQYVTLDSVVAAGKIVGDHHHKAVASVVGAAQASFFAKGTVYEIPVGAMLTMTNVFATRDCYSIPVNTTGESYTVEGTEEIVTSTSTVTGTVVNTTGDDRLLGFLPHLINHDSNETSVMALNFANDGWLMRRDGSPIPAAFADVATTEIPSPVDVSALAQELGLHYWNEGAKITDAESYGAGNYVVVYDCENEDEYTTYLDKLDNELGFEPYMNNSRTDMSDDKVFAATYYKEATETTGEWVLNITYVGNESKIYISINTDVNSLAETLKNDAKANPLAYEEGTGEVSLSMLEMLISDRNGNGFVFQLPNGHFIVNDGGTKAEAQLLVEYLKHLAGTTDGKQNPVYIDAWIATHYHNDHTGILREIADKPALREDIYINAFYSSEPTTVSQIVLYENGEVYENLITQINQEIKAIRAFTKSDTDSSAPELYRLHMGQRYYFNGITMDVVDTQEQHHRSTWGNEGDPDKFNTTSTTCVYTVNATGQKILLGGDSNNVNMEYMMKVYGEDSKTLSNIDVLVAYHHGRNAICDYVPGKHLMYDYNGTADNTWADYLLNNQQNGDQFDVVLFPYYKVFEYQKGHLDSKGYLYLGDDGSYVYPYNIGEINQYLIEHSDAYYTYGYDDMLNSEHGTVQLIFKADGTISPVVYESLYGTTLMEENPNYTIEIMWKKDED